MHLERSWDKNRVGTLVWVPGLRLCMGCIFSYIRLICVYLYMTGDSQLIFQGWVMAEWLAHQAQQWVVNMCLWYSGVFFIHVSNCFKWTDGWKEWIRRAVGNLCRSDSVEWLNRWVAKQVVSEAVSEPVSHPVSRQMGEPISQLENQWANQRVRQKVGCCVSQSQFTNTLTHWFTVPLIEVLPHLLACPLAHLHADSLPTYCVT